MGKLTRFTQLLFGASAAGSRIASFGSLAAGSPVAYSGATITPALVQAESTSFQVGWDDALIGNASPAVQDQNALDYLTFYQLCYLMQQGIPEYDGSTQYFSNSVVMDSTGVLYQATGSTIGVSPPGSNWVVFQQARKAPQTTVFTATGSYTAPSGALYIVVEGVGGGGGGNGQGGTGGSGSATSFGGSLLVCGGGLVDAANFEGGAGGSATIALPAISLGVFVGGAGGGGASLSSSSNPPGGSGGNSIYGGGGGGAVGVGVVPAGPNTGAGGGGGNHSGNPGSGQAGGGAAGAGRIQINNPSGTYACIVGVGGIAGTAGAGTAGGAGADGRLTVTAYFS